MFYAFFAFYGFQRNKTRSKNPILSRAANKIRILKMTEHDSTPRRYLFKANIQLRLNDSHSNRQSVLTSFSTSNQKLLNLEACNFLNWSDENFFSPATNKSRRISYRE